MPMLSIYHHCPSCNNTETVLVFVDSKESKEKIIGLKQACSKCGITMHSEISECGRYLVLRDTSLYLMDIPIVSFSDDLLEINLANLLRIGFGGKVKVVNNGYGDNSEVVYLLDPLFDKIKTISSNKTIVPSIRKRVLKKRRLLKKSTAKVVGVQRPTDVNPTPEATILTGWDTATLDEIAVNVERPTEVFNPRFRFARVDHEEVLDEDEDE